MLCDQTCGAWENPWFVCQTEPCAEFQALRALTYGWMRAYLPVEVTRKQMLINGRPVIIDGKRQQVESLKPFFRGYILVSFDPGVGMGTWGKISHTVGIKRLFMTASMKPIPLRAGVAESIMGMGRAGDGAIDLTAPAFPRLETGATIRFANGPMVDRTALVELDERGRVSWIMSALGGEVRGTVARADVVLA